MRLVRAVGPVLTEPGGGSIKRGFANLAILQNLARKVHDCLLLGSKTGRRLGR